MNQVCPPSVGDQAVCLCSNGAPPSNFSQCMVENCPDLVSEADQVNEALTCCGKLGVEVVINIKLHGLTPHP